MSNISKAFENGKALIGFVTAGDPDIETSRDIILSMADAGCDLMEIGIPFSDPIAEGVTVQEANIRSLSKGTTTDKVFELTNEVSAKTDVPMVYVTYLNVLFKYGYDRFLKNAKESGICGVIIPDMPFEEKNEFAKEAEKYGVDIISFTAPARKERIEKIAENAQGFIYTASSFGVKGINDNIVTDTQDILALLKENSPVPAAVTVDGCDEGEFEKLLNLSDGVILSTKIVEIVEKQGKNAPKAVYDYVKAFKEKIAKQ